MNNTPDIGLLLELNAERRAIAEMLEGEAERLIRSAARTRRDGNVGESDVLAGKSAGHSDAAKLIRARIDDIPAEAETVTRSK